MLTLEQRFGRRLRLIRERHQETRKQVAARIGADPSAVYRWESGEGSPRGAVFHRLLMHYRDEAQFLLFGDESDPEHPPTPHALATFLRTDMGTRLQESRPDIVRALAALSFTVEPTPAHYQAIAVVLAPDIARSR